MKRRAGWSMLLAAMLAALPSLPAWAADTGHYVIGDLAAKSASEVAQGYSGQDEYYAREVAAIREALGSKVKVQYAGDADSLSPLATPPTLEKAMQGR